jgi:hypothetical protein
MSIPIKDLALIVKTKQDLIDALEPFDFESSVEVVIRPIAAKRTLSQNALFQHVFDEFWRGPLPTML